MALSPDKYRQFVSRAKGYTEQWNKFIQSHLVRGNPLFNIRELKNMLRGEHLRYVDWVVPKLIENGVVEIDGKTNKYRFHTIKEIHWSFLYEAIVVNNFDVKTYEDLPPHQKPDLKESSEKTKTRERGKKSIFDELKAHLNRNFVPGPYLAYVSLEEIMSHLTGVRGFVRESTVYQYLMMLSKLGYLRPGDEPKSYYIIKMIELYKTLRDVRANYEIKVAEEKYGIK